MYRLIKSRTRTKDLAAGNGDGRKSERGAALVEMALVTPVFLLMVFFILEMGLLFRDSLTTANISRTAARAASTKGRDPAADYYMLRATEYGLTPMQLENFEYIVIFKASGPGDTVPASCLSGSQTDLCNRYRPIDLFKELDDPVTGVDTGNFRCDVSSVDKEWCPTDRIAKASAPTGPDYVGIHVKTKHRYVTGMFGSEADLDSTTILRIEPDER